MAMDFPNSPSVGQKFTSGGYQWSWDGAKWNAAGGVGSPSMDFLPLTGGTLAGPGNLQVNGWLSNTVTPPADMQPGNLLALRLSVTAQSALAQNAYRYIPGTDWKLLGTGPATRLNMDGGNFTFYTAASGAAGDIPTWVSLGALTADGTLTLGNQINAAGGTLSGPLLLASFPPSAGQLRLLTANSASGYGLIVRHDGANFYLLLTNINDALGTWNAYRPFTLNLATGALTLGAVYINGGLTMNSGVTLANGAALANAQWLYGTDTTGGLHGLITLWSDNNAYVNDSSRLLYLRGSQVLVQDATSNVAIFSHSDTQSTTNANFTPKRWRFAVNSGDEQSTGSIDYRGFDANALGIVGAGTASGNRYVHIWDNLTVTGSIFTQSGSVTANGGQVLSLGAPAGLIFQDRAAGGAGQWQWYSISNVARLWWSGNTDRITLDTAGNLNAVGEVYGAHSLATAGYVWINGVQWQYNGGYMYCPNSVMVYDLISNNNLNAAGHVYIGGTDMYNASGYIYTPNGYGSNGDIYSNNQIRAGTYLNVGGCTWQNSGGWMYSPNGVYSAGQFNGDTVVARGACAAGEFVGGPGNSGYLRMWGTGDHICFRWDGTLHFRVNEAIDWAIAKCDNITEISVSPDGGSTTGWSFIQVCNYGTFYIATYSPSDIRLKSDIRDSEIDALDAILALPVRSFKWNAEARKQMPIIPDAPIGLVAQEVQQVIPYAVGVRRLREDDATPGPRDPHVIMDDRLTPYLVRAIQQLTARVAELEALLVP